jgi:hypothetical protein
MVILFSQSLLSFAVVILPTPFHLPLFVSYAPLHRVLLAMRENVWDMILEVILRGIVLRMRTERKFPTSKDISKRNRKKRGRMGGKM